jgi:hypothetical protein
MMLLEITLKADVSITLIFAIEICRLLVKR